MKKQEMRNMISWIDENGAEVQEMKNLGLTQARQTITDQLDWFLSGIVYDKKQMIAFCSEWLQQSDLIEEYRRTAKEMIQNSVSRVTDKDVSLKMVERKTGKWSVGIHLNYVADALEAERLKNIAETKALAKALQKYSSVFYDAMALVEMEAQEKAMQDSASKASKTKAKKAVEANNKAMASLKETAQARLMARLTKQA